MEDEYMGDLIKDCVAVRIAEIERHAKTAGAITANEGTMVDWRITPIYGGQQSLLMGIAKSAELLGDALDSLDVPEKLLNDLEAGRWKKQSLRQGRGLVKNVRDGRWIVLQTIVATVQTAMETKPDDTG